MKSQIVNMIYQSRESLLEHCIMAKKEHSCVGTKTNLDVPLQASYPEFSSIEPVCGPFYKQNFCTFPLSRRFGSWDPNNKRIRMKSSTSLDQKSPHLVGGNFCCGVTFECSTMLLVSRATDIHRNLLALRIWVTEWNCRSRVIWTDQFSENVQNIY